MNMAADTVANSSVSIRDLGVSYGSARILEGLNIEIRSGEFIVLLGPSGCGKSTLLNAIAGLGEVSKGSIWISGRNVTWSEPVDRGIGMVFQSYALYPRMTVEKNMSFGLRMAGMPKAEIAKRVGRAAEILQLRALLQRRPAELSGGQRQRVAIGRAMVRDAEVFLFDEPLSNLDAKLRAELRVEIKALHQNLNNTMIYVTHDQIEALTLADRIAIMNGGKIQQFAEPGEIYHRPANLFVAGFIGAPGMNILKGILQGGDQPVFMPDTGTPLSLDGYGFTAPVTTQEVTFGIRPEHLILGEGEGQQLSVEVIMVELMGAETILHTRLATGQKIVVRVPNDVAPKRGEWLTVRFQPKRAHLFGIKGDRLVL